MNARQRLAALVASALMPCVAHAGRPLATEDAGVLAAGECEWESMAGRQSSAEPVSRAWSTQIGCGIGAHTQLALGHGRSHSAGSHDQAFTLGGKTGLIDGGEAGPALTLAYGINLLRIADAGFQLDNEAVALVVSLPVTPGTSVHANLGWLRDRSDHRDSTSWNLALETRLSEHVDGGCEWYGDDHSRPWGGLGLRWSWTEHFSLNASLAARAGKGAERLVTVGAKLSF